MKLYLIGHDYKYAAEQMMLSLYPAERPEYPEGKPEESAQGKEVYNLRMPHCQGRQNVCRTVGI